MKHLGAPPLLAAGYLFFILRSLATLLRLHPRSQLLGYAAKENKKHPRKSASKKIDLRNLLAEAGKL